MRYRPRVLVSFDWEIDRRYKHLLEAWDANQRFDFAFTDCTPTEINSSNVGRIKAAITSKIRTADRTLVLVGATANTPHRDRLEIGYVNWINFEVAQSVLEHTKIVAVRLQPSCLLPVELSKTAYTLVDGFGEPKIIQALA